MDANQFTKFGLCVWVFSELRARNLLTTFIANDYESFKQKSKIASWAALKRKCDEAGIVTPSYVT